MNVLGRLKRATLVERLVVSISHDIFKGTFAAGDPLPSLRDLSTRYSVTVPTTQRAIARLEEMGLVDVRHGSGVRVLEVRHHATLSALPYLLTTAIDEPEAARNLIADVLELRRDMLVSLVVRARGLGAEALDGALDGPLADLELAVTVTPRDLAPIVEADLALTRALLELCPQLTYSTVLNVFRRMLEASPTLQRAIFADPGATEASWRRIKAHCCAADVPRQEVYELLARDDALSLDRFVELLESRDDA